jgi:iron complex outermembrane receptor protein
MNICLRSVAFVLLAAPASLRAAETCHVDASAPAIATSIQVHDATGALIPLAVVAIRCGDSTYTVQTNATGEGSVRLRPGTYDVVTQAAGFATSAQPGVAISSAPLSFTLQLGSSTDVVNVSASNGFVPYDSNAGSKTNSPLIEVPQSISIINQLEMESRQVITMNEALRYTPGIQADEYGVELRYDWLKIRGFDAQTFGVFRDGMRFDSLAGKLDPYELESVEVLKGPSSILYGEVPPGGLINQVTKRPGSERRTEVEAQFGSYDRRQGALDTTGSFDRATKFRYRLLGLVRDSGTQVDYVPDNRRLIAPSLTYRPGDRTNFTLLADYQHDGTRWNQFLPAIGTLLPNPNGYIPVSAFTGEPSFDNVRRNQGSFAYTGDHLFLDGWNLHSNYRYQYINFKGQTLYAGGFDGNSTTDIVRSIYTTPNIDRINTVDTRALRRFHTGSFEQTVLFGYDYQHVNNRASSAFIYNVGDLNIYHPTYGAITLPAFAPSSYLNSLLQQHGLYAQDQIKFRQHLILTLGGRQDFAKNDVTNLLTTGNNFAHTDERFTGRAGITYLTDIGIAPYFAYSTSFLPNAGTYVTDSKTGLLTDPAKPSDARQVEGGVKFQPRGGNSFVTASVFQINQTDVLVNDAGFTAHQDGEVRSRGVEVEGIASLSRGLNLHAGYTLTATNVLSAAQAPASVGQWLPQTPRNQASGLLDYTQRGGRFAGLGGNFGVRYVGKNLSNTASASTSAGSIDNNSFYTPSYTLFDAGLRFDYRHTLFAINASNVADTRYVATCYSLNACFYGYARNIIGSAKYHF